MLITLAILLGVLAAVALGISIGYGFGSRDEARRHLNEAKAKRQQAS